MKVAASRARSCVHVSLTFAATLAAAAAGFTPTASRACGACVEDKIAATYDHTAVKRARAGGNVMVFCEVTGPFAAQRLKDAARKVGGIDPKSVRVSIEPAALSFAVDPRRRSPQAALDDVRRAVPPGTTMNIVRLLPTQAPSGALSVQ